MSGHFGKKCEHHTTTRQQMQQVEAAKQHMVRPKIHHKLAKKNLMTGSSHVNHQFKKTLHM